MSRDNRLDGLPVELFHNILSCLVGHLSGIPNTTGLHFHEVVNASPPSHPYYNLAATSRSLRSEVESYCQHLLRRHKDIAPNRTIELSQWPKKSSRRKWLPAYRKDWVKWVSKHCAFCGKGTVRTAIFNNLLSCCKPCDNKQWSDKLTMTTAMDKYHLCKLDLFIPNPLYSADYSPRLRFAVYDCMGIDTTMFLKSDMERWVKYIHGDEPYKEHRNRRNRRRRIEKLMDIHIEAGRWTNSPRFRSGKEEQMPINLDILKARPAALEKALATHPPCARPCELCCRKEKLLRELLREEQEISGIPTGSWNPPVRRSHPRPSTSAPDSDELQAYNEAHVQHAKTSSEHHKENWIDLT